MTTREKSSEASAPDPTQNLVTSAAQLAAEGVRAATTELRDDLEEAGATVAGLSAGAVLMLCGFNLLLFAAAEAAGRRLPRWAALTAVGTAVGLAGAAAGGLAWRRRLRHPLWRTRASLRAKAQRALAVP